MIFNSTRYMQQLRITTTSKERCKYNPDSQTPEFSHLIVRQMQKIHVFFQRKDENGVTAVQTCTNNTAKCNQFSIFSFLHHVGKLVVNGLREEDLPLASELHL